VTLSAQEEARRARGEAANGGGTVAEGGVEGDTGNAISGAKSVTENSVKRLVPRSGRPCQEITLLINSD
jgi:hypothetical protein